MYTLQCFFKAKVHPPVLLAKSVGAVEEKYRMEDVNTMLAPLNLAEVRDKLSAVCRYTY